MLDGLDFITSGINDMCNAGAMWERQHDSYGESALNASMAFRNSVNMQESMMRQMSWEADRARNADLFDNRKYWED